LEEKTIYRYLTNNEKKEIVKDGNNYLCYEMILNLLVELEVVNKENISSDFDNLKLNKNYYFEKKLINYF
jgi:hypothetical protein